MPFLSSIFSTKTGLVYTPLFAKVEYAATISYTLKSGVPSAIEGTGGIRCSIPIFFASLTIGLGPILSINLAVIVLTEFAKAFFKVLVLPYLSPEFFGHHCSTFPNLFFSIQNWLSGNVSQGER